ncbi:MAG: GNAT family N-acetyltransferase [Candidatus Eisenbacteria bacterium]
MLDYGPLRTSNEEEQFRAIAGLAFQFPDAYWAPYVERMGRENIRVIRRGETVVGGLGFYPIGQWFGGRSVRMAGIAAVAVPAEERSHGIAAELMTRTLRELKEAGYPISTLYPATQVLYRKVGYEQAGNLARHELPVAQIGNLGRPCAVEAIDSAERDRLIPCYDRFARTRNGLLDRNPGMWTRLHEPFESKTRMYGAIEGGELTGYVVVQQKSTDRAYDLNLRDFVATTEAALRSLWTFLYGFRSQAGRVAWSGPVNDPFQTILVEQHGEGSVIRSERWMIRVLDVAAALSARGYSSDLNLALELRVEDDLLPENSGGYRLEVSAGRAKVERVEEPRGLRMHVRGLAPLYSGLFGARQLASLGWVEGEGTALDVAERLFAGSEPWMSEGF